MNTRIKKRKFGADKKPLNSSLQNQDLHGPSIGTSGEGIFAITTQSDFSSDTNPSKPAQPLPKKARSAGTAPEQDPPSITEICAAAVRITKSLLGYGAENNWIDVQRSKGRSWLAGDYRRNWLYVSSKNRMAPTQNVEEEKEENTFYYYQPALEPTDKKLNSIVRKAVCAILAHSGSCDEHAYVLATLLRHLLPIGTPINICAFKNNQSASDFPHTFVVIGNAQNENGRLTEEELEKYMANDLLIVADAWPIQGGAILLKDFFLRKNTYSSAVYNSPLSLRVDHTFYADGEDHLTHRIEKQRARVKNAAKKKKGHTFSPASFFFPHHELTEQHKLKISTMPLYGYRESTGMWEANSIAYDSHARTEPENTRFVISEILGANPQLKDLLCQTDDELNIDGEGPDALLPRLGSGFSN